MGYLDRRTLPLICIILALEISSAFALDPSIDTSNESPFEFFKIGVAAYKSGDKGEAIKSLRYAADMGHTGANWKLARMYATGDGINEDDAEAYKLFTKIVNDSFDLGSQNRAYISDALVALGNYNAKGIQGVLKVDKARARNFYTQAANYGNAEAQYQLGLMLMQGEGGNKDSMQAARWLQYSARKGNPAAQAMLGNMLFQAGKTVRGLAMMTAAYNHANIKDREWIQKLQESAFAITSESDRRTAITLANDLVKK